MGRKTIRITRKIYLKVKIWKFEIAHSFLIVAGLSTDVILGADFLKAYGGIIDFKKETFELMGESLPKNIVMYRSVINNDSVREPRCYGLKINMQKYVQEKNTYARDYEIGGDKGNFVDQQANLVEKNKSDSSIMEKINNYDKHLHELNDNEKSQIQVLLHKHRDVFSDEPGCTDIYEHEIKVMVPKPFVRKSYPIPLHVQSAVDKEIKKMLEQGIIQRSCGEFCNPIRVVKKKNGEVRVCLDARWLNKIVAVDNESPPRIEEILQKHEGAKYFSITDLTKGYWQVKLTPESRKYTAFLYNNQMYKFTRIPFGLKTAGAGFIRALSRALQRISHFATAYIDDMLVSSKTFSEHLSHLDMLFSVLKKVGFKLSIEKSLLFQKHVQFLGFILDSRGISADPGHVEKILNFPCPRNRQELQGFLGVCGYYRRFSVKHENYIEPFRNLLQTGKT